MKEDTDKTWMEVHGGFAKDMTMRDHFAGLAMQEIIHEGFDLDETANRAYQIADAMLKARGTK
jgi:hypothetical protein